MKRKLIVAIFALCGISGYTQTDSSFIEVGVNAVPVFRSIQKENSDIEYSPYTLTLEKKFGKVGLRAGIGYSSDSFTELAGETNGNTEFTVDTASMDVRLGLVFYKDFKKSFSIKYGIDGIISNRSKEYNTLFIDEIGEEREVLNTTTSKGVGASPFIFFQYHVTPNFSLGTELSLRLLSANMEEKQESTETPGFNSLTSYSQTTFSVVPPSALFLIVRF